MPASAGLPRERAPRHRQRVYAVWVWRPRPYRTLAAPALTGSVRAVMVPAARPFPVHRLAPVIPLPSPMARSVPRLPAPLPATQVTRPVPMARVVLWQIRSVVVVRARTMEPVSAVFICQRRNRLVPHKFPTDGPHRSGARRVAVLAVTHPPSLTAQ